MSTQETRSPSSRIPDELAEARRKAERLLNRIAALEEIMQEQIARHKRQVALLKEELARLRARKNEQQQAA